MSTLEQKILDASTVAVLLVDPAEGRVVRANQAAAQLLVS